MCAFWPWSGRREGDLPPLAGYVLAGGRSSRMGTNKALLPLAGKPLLQHAITRLSRLCSPVRVLSNDPALGSFAPLVPDRHPDCGPLSGIEAALLDSEHDWNLILPVDVPFLTTAYLDNWLGAALHRRDPALRISTLSVGPVHHPTLLILHRELAPYLTASLQAGRYKLYPVLCSAAESFARQHGTSPTRVFWNPQASDVSAEPWTGEPSAWRDFRFPRPLPPDFDEFMNLNTPAEFAAAEQLAYALDT